MAITPRSIPSSTPGRPHSAHRSGPKTRADTSLQSTLGPEFIPFMAARARSAKRGMKTPPASPPPEPSVHRGTHLRRQSTVGRPTPGVGGPSRQVSPTPTGLRAPEWPSADGTRQDAEEVPALQEPGSSTYLPQNAHSPPIEASCLGASSSHPRSPRQLPPSSPPLPLSTENIRAKGQTAATAQRPDAPGKYPFVGPIQYTYPIQLPLVGDDPTWLEQMMTQLRGERFQLQQYMEESRQMFDRGCAESRLMQIELEREQDETADLIRNMVTLAGPAYGEWFWRQYEEGMGDLSLDSDFHNPESNELPSPCPPSRKRRREDDGDDDEGDQDSNEEPQVRDVYKRRKLELQNVLEPYAQFLRVDPRGPCPENNFGFNLDPDVYDEEIREQTSGTPEPSSVRTPDPSSPIAEQDAISAPSDSLRDGSVAANPQSLEATHDEDSKVVSDQAISAGNGRLHGSPPSHPVEDKRLPLRPQPVFHLPPTESQEECNGTGLSESDKYQNEAVAMDAEVDQLDDGHDETQLAEVGELELTYPDDEERDASDGPGTLALCAVDEYGIDGDYGSGDEYGGVQDEYDGIDEDGEENEIGDVDELGEEDEEEGEEDDGEEGDFHNSDESEDESEDDAAGPLAAANDADALVVVGAHANNGMQPNGGAGNALQPANNNAVVAPRAFQSRPLRREYQTLTHVDLATNTAYFVDRTEEDLTRSTNGEFYFSTYDESFGDPSGSARGIEYPSHGALDF
ncbi:uncharacterized protein FIBRA_02244 [Fibroporia radiculosa]|uniref:Uncharacterized protein n=1 Tax=Fibroporia radiculosa TaxID=599839 RepID=J4I8Y4_9APHY|nr:uncharacterized protein FIBRA_02244 [Fibroporia radiculosa]CCM00216.1 predicted protein [Fibroporia radiculosa]